MNWNRSGLKTSNQKTNDPKKLFARAKNGIHENKIKKYGL